MRPSTFLRALRAKVQPSPITPWPAQSSFDQWLTGELDCLRECPIKSYTSSQWFLQAFQTVVAAQRIAIDSLANNVYDSKERKYIEEYLEDVVEMLDACEGLREKTYTVQKYVDSLKIILRCFEGTYEPNTSMVVRARTALDSCEAIERRCCDLDKCNSALRNLGEKLAQRITCGTKLDSSICNTELSEILNGSKAIALFVCGVLGISLSFKSKRGLPSVQSNQTTCWSTSLHELYKQMKEEIDRRRKSSNIVLVELSEAVHGAKKLRELLSTVGRQDLKENIESLRSSCGDLGEGIKPMEGKVNEVYKSLILIRMALLGIISQS